MKILAQRASVGGRISRWMPVMNLSSRFITSSAYVKKHTKVRGEPIPEEAAMNSPGIQALAARLNITDVPPTSIARSFIDSSSSLKFVNNSGLSKFGKTLISFYVYEHFMRKYPRLPSRVLSEIAQIYASSDALSQIGKIWGVQVDTRSAVERFLSSTNDEDALGCLNFTNRTEEVEPGVVAILPKEPVNNELKNAMGGFVKSLVASVYAHRGLDATASFIQDYIIKPRKVDIEKLLQFSQPSRELALLCVREGLEKPVFRMLAESGRYSNMAVFVIGAFAGAHKIGEGQGTSLREAKTRAAVNALKGWYLYTPSAAMVERANTESRAAYIDAGEIVI